MFINSDPDGMILFAGKNLKSALLKKINKIFYLQRIDLATYGKIYYILMLSKL